MLWLLTSLSFYYVNIFPCQTCICANRILVQDQVYDEFASKFAAAVDKQMTVGNGMEASSTQGPLINEKAVQKVQYSFVLCNKFWLVLLARSHVWELTISTKP